MLNLQAEEKVLCSIIERPHPHIFFPFPVTGVLKGYDQLLNLVLDDVEELLLGNVPNQNHAHQMTHFKS